MNKADLSGPRIGFDCTPKGKFFGLPVNGIALIASADTLKEAGEHLAQWRDLGTTELRGRPEPLHILGFSG
jgi:hypothetical protein